MNSLNRDREKKIGKHLRNLLMRDEHTLMLSRTKAIYFGEVYTFEEVKGEEIKELTAGLLKILDKKSWAKTLLNYLKPL